MQLKTRIGVQVSILLGGLLLSLTSWSAPTGKFYRYYDHRGIAVTSSTVTPSHIRHGYEVLNERMDTVYRVPAGTPASDAAFQRRKDAEEKQRQQDDRLIQAYGSSSRAIAKRDEIIRGLNANLEFHRTQYQKLNNTYNNLISQESNYKRSGQTVPSNLAEQVKNTRISLQRMSNSINTIEQNKIKTENEYNHAINRLKALGR